MPTAGLRALIAAGALALAAAAAGPAAAAAPGSLDPSFGKAGIAAVPAGVQLYGVAAEPGGGAVIAGAEGGSVYLERLDASGNEVDAYHGPAGVAHAVAIAPGGEVVLAGESGGAMIVQELSPSLGPTPIWSRALFAGQSAAANGVAIAPAPDGSIVAVGEAGGQTALARLAPDGALDWQQSGIGSGTNGSQLDGVAIAGGGEIIAVGDQGGLQLTNGLVLALSAGGALSHASLVYYPGSGYTVLTSAAAQPDGEVIAGGLTDQPYALAVRITSAGSLDSGFGSSPAQGYPSLAALPAGENVQEPDYPFGAYGVGIGGGGTVIAAGNYEDTGVSSDQALYAFTPSGQPDAALSGGQGTSSQGTATVTGPQGDYEACAMAVDPDSGDVITVGDSVAQFPVSNPCGLDPTQPTSAGQGFVSRLIGFGPPPAPPAQPPPPGAAPTATTGAADAIGQSTATLAGTVDPDGLATSYRFQYGTSAAYGTSTPSQSAGAGAAAVAVGAQLAGLAPGRTYHYRLVATNADGAAYGADATFTTARASVPASRLTIRLVRLARAIADGALRARGLRLALRCTQPCSFSVALIVPKAAARRARLGNRQLTLGRIGGTAAARRVVTVTLRLSKAGRRELANRSLDALIVLSARSRSGTSRATVRRGLALRG